MEKNTADRNALQRTFPNSQLQGHFSSGTVELYQVNHGMAGNREAGGFVNRAVIFTEILDKKISQNNDQCTQLKYDLFLITVDAFHLLRLHQDY